MGYTSAVDFIEQAGPEVALRWHLRSNHFPPVHESFVPAAQQAIEACNDGDYDTIIDLPNGKRLAVDEIIRGLHLEAWITFDEAKESPGDFLAGGDTH